MIVFTCCSDGPSPPMLVLCSWSGYKFPGVCLNLLAYLTLGQMGYYAFLVYNVSFGLFFQISSFVQSLCCAVLIRGVMRVAWLASSSLAMGKYFLFVVMVLQFVFPLLL